jgi:oxygen-independent coproporphyrinogen-3 oxidase
MIVAHDLTQTHAINLDVFRRYAGLSLPRHVSYPMPTWWQDVDAATAVDMLSEARMRTPHHDLAIYLHLPFCETLCKFCACNKTILRKDAPGASRRVDQYLSALETEIERLADDHRPLRQVHWGGGSPTYLDSDQIARVQRTLTHSFELATDAEVAMEIDPRHVDHGKLRDLHDLGFNRLSMGVQDFDDTVQQHVRRVQPLHMVREVVRAARALGFASINFDLIYGMPYQTPDTIRDTVEKCIELAPDRIAYYHYAQIPEKIATQRGMDYTKLPDSEAKLEMFLIGLDLFQAAGYEYIGLDHFAKPDEALARGLETGEIQRNFQGMTTGAGLCLLGVGVSAISHFPEIGFLQNVKDIDKYCGLIAQGGLAAERGKRFSFDDRLRQAVINDLYCRGEIHPQSYETAFGIDFTDYFARELTILKELESDGIVIIVDGTIRATMPLGRVLLRNVAAVFDVYLHPEAYKRGEEACFSANA